MDSGVAVEMLKTVPVICPKCKSPRLLVFFERKIDKCLAIACVDCLHFQIYGVDYTTIKKWFKDHGVN